jgi:hypothetical protein
MILSKLLDTTSVSNMNIVGAIAICDVCNAINDFCDNGARGRRLNM